MTDELEQDIEGNDINAESATAEAEESTNDPESQPAEKPKPNGYEKRIATLVHREKQKEREAAQLKAELETLKAMQKPDEPAPEFPSDDLKYDDPNAYKAQLDAYYKHTAEQTFKSQQKALQEANQRREAEEQQRSKQARQQDIVQGYIENGLVAGISEEKMAANEAILSQANMDIGLVEDLYSDQDGAKLVDFLADNPDKLRELSEMSPYQAAVKIATEIKPTALSSKPTSTNAPDPIEPTQGGGLPPSDGLKWIGGAKFE